MKSSRKVSKSKDDVYTGPNCLRFRISDLKKASIPVFPSCLLPRLTVGPLVTILWYVYLKLYDMNTGSRWRYGVYYYLDIQMRTTKRNAVLCTSHSIARRRCWRFVSILILRQASSVHLAILGWYHVIVAQVHWTLHWNQGELAVFIDSLEFRVNQAIWSRGVIPQARCFNYVRADLRLL